ncbi:hypothetical protein BGC99_005054, partial [Escherichia coli]|nr:hypothetical protein [Escherichia coli]
IIHEYLTDSLILLDIVFFLSSIKVIWDIMVYIIEAIVIKINKIGIIISTLGKTENETHTSKKRNVERNDISWVFLYLLGICDVVPLNILFLQKKWIIIPLKANIPNQITHGYNEVFLGVIRRMAI